MTTAVASENTSCPISSADLPGVTTVNLNPESKVADYQEAMELANSEAAKRFEEYMLMSWYDRDRNFESPQNASEGPEGSPLNGYILYALHRNATLKVDVEDGRFVFFYTEVEW